MNFLRKNLIFNTINERSMITINLNASHISNAITTKSMAIIVESIVLEDQKIKNIMPDCSK